METTKYNYVYLLPALLLGVFYLFRAADFAAHDFANYYFGGYFLRLDQFSADIYFPYWFNKNILEAGYSGIFVSYAPNTPFLAFAFMPLSLLPIGVAKLIFNAINLLLFLWGLHRLATHYKVDPAWLVAVPIVFFVPIRNQILFGQVYFMLFFMLAAFWIAYENRLYKTAAVWLSLAIMLKVFPVLLLLPILFRKQFHVLFYVATCCFVLFVTASIFTRLDIWLFYIGEVLPKVSRGEISTAITDNYQSVFMFLKRLFVVDAVENPNALAHNPILFHALMIAFKIAVLAIGFYAATKKLRALWMVAFWTIAMIVLSPYGSTYTFILFAFVFMAIAASETPTTLKICGFLLLTVVSNWPLSVSSGWVFPLTYVRLFMLILLFAMILYVIRHEISWKLVCFLTIAVGGLTFFWPKSNVVYSRYLSNKALPVLVYDYSFVSHRLKYDYFGDDGFGRAELAGSLFDGEPTQLELRGNEIYHNGKLVQSDSGNKRKPFLVGEKIVYLSDYGRGIGFYTLRMIDLKK